jgi:hypothetical protein
MLSDSATPRTIWIYGEDIGEARMAALWEYAHSHTPHDFGRLIAADQDWLGACRYAGIGLGTGSGYSWHDRNVVLWVWTDAVDMTVARRTIMDLIDSLVPPTTTTTTTTTTTLPAPVDTATDPSPVLTEASSLSAAAMAQTGIPAATKPAAGTSSAKKAAPARRAAPKRKSTATRTRPKVIRGLGVQRG